jgi:hypothetical protein
VERIGQLPASLFIDGVVISDREPAVLGEFSDVYRGTHLGQSVAVKRLRMVDAVTPVSR